MRANSLKSKYMNRSVTSVAMISCLILAMLSSLLTPPATRAQVRPIYDYGASGLGQVLLRLQTTGSIMYTGAHPDDEDSGFLAYAARGLHARTAYLSLTRGDGGQNQLGTEQSEALGVIRTEELLQARRLDGGEQYFTRAFDFGFTKTLDEAKARWPEQEVLADAVRAIRLFRPLVVVAGFTGTSADGHGQHQYAGYITPKAIAAAADPAQFPDQIRSGLSPWRVRKVYVRANPRNPDNLPTLQVETGTYDPLLGRSYAEIASEGRTLHRTQEQGGIEQRGVRFSYLRLISGLETYRGKDNDPFTAIDTSLAGVATGNGIGEPKLNEALQRSADAAKRALTEFDAQAPQKIIPALAEGLTALRSARQILGATTASQGREDTDFILAKKEAEFVDALKRAAGIQFDVLADKETLAAGDSCTVNLRAYYPIDAPVTSRGIGLLTPPGWDSVPAAVPAATPSATPIVPPPAGNTRVIQNDIKLTAGPTLTRTEPYWLAEPRNGDLYRWPLQRQMWSRNDPLNHPFSPVRPMGQVDLEIGGVGVQLQQPLEYRYADGIRGEIRREVNVVPAVSLELDQHMIILSRAARRDKIRLVVVATNNADRALTGKLSLRLPPFLTAAPGEIPLSFTRKGERQIAVFQLTPSDGPDGSYEILAQAAVEGQTFTQRMATLSYPHIQTHRIYLPAAAAVRVFNLKVAPVNVGYVMGVGDTVPDAIRQMGLPVTVLDDHELAVGDLSRFDTIVVGVRATDASDEFTAHHARLLDYARAGGTLIVQYQRPNYAAAKLPPFTTKMNPRIVDEKAAVKILAPEDQLFNWPNKITPEDWNGWVQERTLYSFTEFGPEYRPMVEMNDPGEGPQNGGEVVATLGKGLYIYTAFAWFRQLPAGVPGAYRLFANLLSRGKEPSPTPPPLPARKPAPKAH